MAANIAKGTLAPARQRLVELMQRINFGQIVGLQVRHGEPLLHPRPQVIRDIKLASEPPPRSARHGEDFLLKQQVIELFAFFDRLQNGVIDLLEVKNGLPFRLQHTDDNA